MNSAKQKAQDFCQRLGLRVPILLAPMAGACPASLSIAVANAGGLGACGAVLMKPKEILTWAEEVRAGTAGPFQINLWIPDPPPLRDADHEARVRTFLAQFGPEVPLSAGDATPPDFGAQCEAVLNARPAMVSSVMGLYPPEFVQKLKHQGIKWCANITTVAEAIAASAAGADLVAAQGAEAGGHRGSFNAEDAERKLVGLFSLLPAVVDAVRVPVIATGGIADARGVAAALTLGASAVQIGTGFLRTSEAKLHPAWAEALAHTAPEDTVLTRAFSGRAGRSIATTYIQAAASADSPSPAPYPVQRGLTSLMRAEAQKQSDIHRMQAWAGQSAAMARAEPAGKLMRKWWEGAQELLPE
jgi:nitronate monooxygenase